MQALVATYLPSFQISAASFQFPRTFSHRTTYLPVTSFGAGSLVFKLKVPISRAANRPGRYPRPRHRPTAVGPCKVWA